MEHGLHEDTPFAACMNRQQALQRHNVSQTRTSDLKVGMHAALKGTPTTCVLSTRTAWIDTLNSDLQCYRLVDCYNGFGARPDVTMHHKQSCQSSHLMRVLLSPALSMRMGSRSDTREATSRPPASEA